MLFVFAMISNFSYGQLVTTIDFETEDAGYTPSAKTGSGNTDAFNRTNTGVNGNSSFYWVAEDLSGNPSIDLAQINITGSTSFTFAVDLSYDNAVQWDSSDELIITYSIDGGAFQNLMAVQHINTDGFNNPAALDFDFDGNGDSGQELSITAFNSFTTGSIALSSNTTLDIKLQFNNLTSNGEGVFMDNIIITETAASSDPTIGFDAATSSQTETDATFNVSIPITVSNYGTDQIDVSVAVSGTAEVADYTLNTASLSFTADATQNISLDINPDSDDFDDEEIILTITETSSVTGLIISQATHTVTVTEDETAPTIGFDSATSTETETDATFNVSIPITVSNYGTDQIDVSVAVSGTAEVADYTLNTASLSFTADGTQNISLDINDDADSDAETVILTITETSAVSGLVISQSTHTVTITDDEVPPVPTAGTVFITEVSDAASSANEYIEIYNNSNESVSVSTSKLVMLNSGGTVETIWDFDDDIGTASIPARGFLIITRGGTQVSFEGVHGSLNANTVFIQGTSVMYFGTGTSRRWRLYDGGTVSTADGTLIDDTEATVGGDNRHYQNIFTDIYISDSEASATPGALEYLVYSGGAWVNSVAMDATTAAKDAYIYDDYTVSANAAANNIGINTGNTLTVNSSIGLDVDGDLTVNGNMTLNSGGSLIVSGTSSGNVTYKRTLTYDPDNAKSWHLVSSPLSGETMTDMRANNSFVTNGSSEISFAPYDNSQAVANDRWAYFGNTATDALINGKGYSTKIAAAGDISFTGTINTADVAISLTMGGGSGNNFNLLGNPFTSSINSGTFLTANTDQLEQEDIYVWNEALEDYVTKISGEAFKVSPGQGFFVEAKTTNSVTFSESIQSHETDDFQKTSRTEIKLNITDGSIERFADIYYIAVTTTGFDNGYDGKLFGGVSHPFALYTHLIADNEGEKYQIQSLPNSNLESMIVPVGVNAAAGKEITFSADALNLPTDIKVFLEDRLTNTFTRLDETNSEYQVTLTEALNGVGRFYLHTAQSALSTEDIILNSVRIFKTNASTLKITGLPQGKTSFYLYNILGKEMMTTIFTSNGNKEISLSKLTAGIYLAKIQTEKGAISKKIILE